MVLDIRQVSAGKVATTATRGKKSAKTDASTDTEASQTGDDSVELTGAAAQLGSLIQQMVAAPAVERSRVDPIKEKIAQDRYHVEGKQIANRMLDFEFTLGRAR